MRLHEELYFSFTIEGTAQNVKKFVSFLLSGDLDEFFEITEDNVIYSDNYRFASAGETVSVTVSNDDYGIEIDSFNPEEFLDDAEQKRRIARVLEHGEEIRRLIATLPDYDRVREAMIRLGAPIDAEGVGVDEDMLNVAMHCCKDYRSRYTLIKTIDECGLLDEYLAEYPL